ncbi:MAG: S26 family signal peptidase [Acidiferrobacteraceae bacterium]
MIVTPLVCAGLTRRPRWRRLRGPAVGLAALLAGALAGFANGYRINLSPSEPLGLWRVLPVRHLARGDDVGFCAPVHPYPFLEAGVCPDGLMPFVKQIVGLPGDRIVETDRGVTVNGQELLHSRPHRRSMGAAIPLPQWRGRLTLSADEYWTYGGNDPGLSFDSRYWGPLRRARIRFIARPVLTLGD